MTALNILIQVITDIYRNPKFLFLVVIPVHLVIAVFSNCLKLIQNEYNLGLPKNEAVLLLLLATAALITVLLLASTAIGWHRLVLSPAHYPTLQSAMSNQPRWRYLKRAVPLVLIAAIIVTIAYLPAQWIVREFVLYEPHSTSYPLQFLAGVFVFYGGPVLFNFIWTTLGLGLPAIALGQWAHWRLSANWRLQHSGSLVLILAPVLVLSAIVTQRLDAIYFYSTFKNLPGVFMIEALKGAWTGLIALLLLGLITRFYEQLVQPQTSGA